MQLYSIWPVLYSSLVLRIYPRCSMQNFIPFWGWQSTVWIYTLLTHSSADERWCYFCLTIMVMNNDAMNIHVQVFIWMYVFISLGYIPRTAGSMFTFWRNCQAVFLKGYTILYSHQQCMRVPVFPNHHQYLPFCKMVTVSVMCDICGLISPRTNADPNFFLCLLTICMSFLEKYLQVLCHFLNLVTFFCQVIIVLRIFWIWDPTIYVICKYFLPFCELSFYFLILYFNVQKVLIMIKSNSLFSTAAHALGNISKYHCLIHSHKDLYLHLFLKAL